MLFKPVINGTCLELSSDANNAVMLHFPRASVQCLVM